MLADRPTIHAVHGFLGSGKTTFARRLAAELGAVRLNPDEWMVRLYGQDPPAEHFSEDLERVEGVQRELAAALLRAGQDVVLDDGFWTRAYRDRLRAFAAQHGARLRLYRAEVPEAEARARIERRNALPGELYIAPETYAALLPRFEPLGADEPFTPVEAVISPREKLVRDRIPELFGGVVRVLDDAGYDAALRAKLREEALEVQSADREHLPEELADVLEVLLALAARHGLGAAELEAMRARKAAERGGFAGRMAWRAIQGGGPDKVASMTTPAPHFPPRLSVPLVNARTGRPCVLTRADALEPTPERLAEIVAANNEPEIHRWLWQERFGRPYAPEDAQRFLSWAAEGWRDGTHFVFVVLTATGDAATGETATGEMEASELVAALDIKSADLAGAEIGYWQRAAHGGTMTAAVEALCALAQAAGFRSLHALVQPGNAPSAAVLGRAGFAEVTGEERAGMMLRRFELGL